MLTMEKLQNSNTTYLQVPEKMKQFGVIPTFGTPGRYYVTILGICMSYLFEK